MMITKREAAQILGVRPSTVQRLMDRGELAPIDFIKAGDKVIVWLFDESDVHELAKTRMS